MMRPQGRRYIVESVGLTLLICLAGCSTAPKPIARQDPPLPGGWVVISNQSASNQLIGGGAGPERFVDPQSIRLSLTATNGPHVEYWLVGTNTGATFGHCCPITGVEITFPTTESYLYFVQVRDWLDPVRVDVESATGLIRGFSRVDIHRPPSTNETSYLTNGTSWATLSRAIPGTGSNVTWRGNIVYSNAFFRVRAMANP